MDALKLINGSSMKETTPVFGIGDTVRVDVKIREGDRERIQAFEGTVIAKRGSGALPKPSPSAGFPMASVWRGYSPCIPPTWRM